MKQPAIKSATEPQPERKKLQGEIPLIHGVLPAICTPFNDAGDLDEKSLRRLVDFQIECGAHGITACGLAGEMFKLTDREREKVVVTIVDQVNGSIPVIAGVGNRSTEEAIQSCRHAQESGANCVMLMPPSFSKPTLEAIYEFYAVVAAAIQIPIMVQDAGALTGIDIPSAFLARMANEISRIKFIKIETQPTFLKILRVLRAVETEAETVAGLGASNFLEELESGALGTISSCVYTDALVRVYKTYQSMGYESAWKEFQSVLPLVRFCGLSLEMSFLTAKHLLFLAGVIESAYVRGPTTTLDPLNYRQLHHLASMAQLRVLDTRRFPKASGS